MAADETDDALLHAGTVVAGRYQIVRPIASGGMGQVYEAINTVVGSTIALKTLHGQHTSRKDLVARFRREAQAASAVGHENIVVFTDYGFDPNLRLYYLCSEYLRGKELRALMNAGELTKADLFEIMLQVCGAVDAAHRKGVVHRDLKPENIIIVRDRRGMLAKVLDFGIAKVLDAEMTADLKTKTNVALGTPGYMSPEQFNNSMVDARSDVFALGCILYECLAGKEPFDSSSLHAMMVAMIAGDRAPLPDAKLEAIVAPALRWDHATRTASAKELANALELYQAEHPNEGWIIHAPSIPSPSPTPVPPKATGNHLPTPPEEAPPPEAAGTVKAPMTLAPPPTPATPLLPEPAERKSTHISWSGDTPPGSPGFVTRYKSHIAVGGAAIVACAVALFVLVPRQSAPPTPVVVHPPPTTVVPTPVTPAPEPATPTPAPPTPVVVHPPPTTVVPTPVTPVADRRGRHGRRGSERNVRTPPPPTPPASTAPRREAHCADQRYTYDTQTQQCCRRRRSGVLDCDGEVER